MIHIEVDVSMHIVESTNTNKQVFTYIGVTMNACIHTCLHGCMFIYIHMYIYIHTYICISKLTHTYKEGTHVNEARKTARVQDNYFLLPWTRNV